MKYKRAYIDDCIFGTPYKLGTLPKLPMIEFKSGKWTIKVTDFRCLNEHAVFAFERCLLTAATDEEAEFAQFDVADADCDMVNLVSDICLAIGYEARKRGYSIGGTFLVISCRIENNVLTMDFARDHAKAIYEYAQSQDSKDEIKLNIVDMILHVAESKVKNEPVK